MSERTILILSERELATVLAALRAFRRLPSEMTEPENDIATNAGKFDALTNEEIDELGDRLADDNSNVVSFARMLAHAVPEYSGLVNDNTGALMTPADIRKTARHVLKLD